MESIDKNLDTLVSVISRIGGGSEPTSQERAELTYALKNALQEAVVGTMNTDPDTNIAVAAGARYTPGFTNNNGVITCSAFECYLYDNDNFQGNPKPYTVPAKTFTLVDGSAQYIYASLDNGVASYQITTDREDVNGSCCVLIFKVWRVGTKVHSYDTDAHGSGLMNKVERSLYDTVLYKRSIDGGLIISESLTPNPRTIAVSPAKVYIGATPVSVLDFNSSSNNMYEMVNTGGTWSQTKVSVYNNTQINAGDGGASTMLDDYWSLRWFYRSIGDDQDVFYVLGTAAYDTKAAAELEGIRTDVPELLKGHCLLVGRSVVQKGATSGEVVSVFTETFTASSVINHNDTGNKQGGTVGEYNHLTDAEVESLQLIHAQNTDTTLDSGGDNEITAATIKSHVVSTSNPHTVTKTQVGLSNVPNLDTTSAVNKAHNQNTDTSLDSGGSNEISAATIKSHVNNASNPHTVTKTQVGLGSVPNLDTTSAVSHASATGNPHSTTHDETTGVQGGTTGQHYHLTATDYTDKITNRRFGDVAGGNYTQFSSSGHQTMVGDATVWKDIDMPIIIRTSGGNVPLVSTFIGNITAVQFRVNDYTVLEPREYPHEYKLNSTVYLHMHVATNGVDTTDRYLKFELEYVTANPDSAFPSSTTLITSSDLLIPANTPDKTHLLVPITTISPTSMNLGRYFIFRVRRIASTGTAPTSNPFVLAIQLHIECDSIGSNTISSK